MHSGLVSMAAFQVESGSLRLILRFHATEIALTERSPAKDCDIARILGDGGLIKGESSVECRCS